MINPNTRSPIRYIRASHSEEANLSGTIVLRGELERGAKLNVSGEIKIGRFAKLGDPTKIHCHAESPSTGGSIIVTKRAAIPASCEILADRWLLFAPAALPEQGVFDGIRLMSPMLDVCNAPALMQGRRVSLQTVEDPSTVRELNPNSSILYAGIADGASVSIFPFGTIEARSLKNFNHTRGEGLIADTLSTDYLTESTVRARKVRIGVGGETLMFFPLGTDLGDPPSYGFMFAPNREDFRLPVADLLTRLGTWIPKAREHEESRQMGVDMAAEIGKSALSDSGNLAFYDPDNYKADYEGGDIVYDHPTEEIIEAMDPADKTDAKRYCKKLYEKLVEALLKRSGEFERMEISIDRLEAMKSGDVIAGHSYTKVFVQTGLLKLGEVSDRGVLVRLAGGDVEITRGFFETATLSDPMNTTVITAPRIHLSKEAFKNIRGREVQLQGEVFVEGKRREDLETPER